MGEMLKEFLVGLKFGVDEKTLAAFNKSIASAALRITALYASIKTSAAGIFYGISKISDSFEELGYNLRIIAPPITKVLQLRQEMMKAYGAAGIDLKQAVQQSVLFNFSLAKTKYALDALVKGTAIRFLPMLTKQMDIFRSQIYANMPRIQNMLEKFVNFIFKAFEATVIFGNRLWSTLEAVYNFFKRLDDATGGWSTILLAAVAAWKLLNLSFIATPIGMLLTGLTALFALWDDFKTFQEGGQSLINWGSDTIRIMTTLVTAVGAVTAAFAAFWAVQQTGYYVMYGVSTALKIYQAIQAGVNAVMLANPIGLIIAGFTAFIALLAIADEKWKIFGGHFSGFLSGVGGKIMDFVGGKSAPDMSASLGSIKNPTALGSDNSSSTSNQTINMNNNMTVNGVSDARTAANLVMGGQKNVANDTARNFKAVAH